MLKEEELTYAIRGCAYQVFRGLGYGFLEKVYEKAPVKELRLQRLDAASQVPIKVHYKNAIIGECCADIVVENRVILELKAQQQLSAFHEEQLLNYL